MWTVALMEMAMCTMCGAAPAPVEIAEAQTWVAAKFEGEGNARYDVEPFFSFSLLRVRFCSH